MDLHTQLLIGVALVAGLYMAWSIGANDVANAMGTSVGSGALTLKRAVILAGIFEFAGAFLVGSHVSETVRSGIFDPMLFAEEPDILVIGMIGSLLAAGAWLQLASYFGWPVSTTHTIVGAVIGFGMIAAGVSSIRWMEVGSIAASWVISPVLSAAISYLIFRYILRRVFYQPNPIAAAKQVTPYLVCVVVVILALVTNVKALGGMWRRFDLQPLDSVPLLGTLGISTLIGIIGFFVSRRLVERINGDVVDDLPQFEAQYIARGLRKTRMHLRRINTTARGPMQQRVSTLLDEVRDLSREAEKQASAQTSHKVYRKVERIFVYLQILSACFVAFAHGANDVANAIGPLSAAVQVAREGAIAASAAVPTWALALGGFGIVVGLATWGWRVIETIGKRITELTPTRGFCAEFGAAVTILLASVLGLPVSTTHTLVGAVLGVGMARGLGALNLNTVRDIVASWVVTLPAGMGLSIVFFYLLKLTLL